ncbi:hypothetical protein WICMUC_001753 [Wickerhamomyces mucosus]|uniref:Importin N-terminal domain-containing protein n=1 Tax=Wickerhamomyces mucosus TaxID=1378264 RepID=A0A9P8TFS2_9ASCO|nr:hypothetical protein WICMUC_001753 [Wickerhamomyces mucosus]
MDVSLLHECLNATLNSNQTIRQQAEVQLRQAEQNIGFLGACLDIIINNDVDPAVKVAAAVFFKNRTIRRWTSYEDDDNETKIQIIDNDEKPIIRERLLDALVKTNSNLRKQLIPVLTTIISNDYPNEWSNLLESALNLLYAQNLDSAYTGLLCFAKITSSFRWSSNENRPALDHIINQYFPTLLQIADSLLNEESKEAAEMTVLLLKTYKYSTYHDLPIPLQTPENVTSWCNFHVNVINKQLPEEIYKLDESDRKFHPWIKAKKWAYANLYRLFSRYASSGLSKKFTYTEFFNNFNENFIPQLLNLYLSQIDQWCSEKLYIGEEPLYHLISTIENAILQKQTWPLIKPHFQVLVSNFIFPLLCPSDDTLERFENDPEDYIHTKLDIFEETNSPDLAAISLLMTLISKKKKTTLESISTFAFTLLNQYKDISNQSLDDAKKLEGALRLIGCLSGNFTNSKSPFYSQMEHFLSSLLFQHLQSPYPFIKARTCEIVAKFSDLEFKDPDNLAILYRGILISFEDDNLPVQLEAALALQSFVKIPQFQEALSSIILPTMQKLLQLSNTIDTEAISGVMQELVEVFSEELQPFGVDLMSNLVEQFLRLAKELNDAANADVDDLENGYDDLTDKQMAALGLLNTMITVLLSFESSVEIVHRLEEIFFPVCEFVLKNNMEDFFREIGELVETSTFLLRSISPIIWKVFEYVVDALINGMAILYLEDFMPCLNNYLVYGVDQLKTNENYTKAFIQLFTSILQSDETDSELVFGGEIAHRLILALGPEQSQPYIESILTYIINAIVNEQHITKSFAINMLDAIIAGLIYHTQTTLATLAKGNYLLPFFNLWFKHIPGLKRVYDLKLSALGLLALLKLSPNDINQLQIDTIVSNFGPNLAIIMQLLPQAIQNLEKRRKGFDDAGDEYGEYNYDEDEGEWEEEDADEDAEIQANSDYLEFLNEEAEKLKNFGHFADDDDDDFDEDITEDPLANTILDGINIFAAFKETVLSVQASEPEKYQVVFGKLNKDQQEILQNVMEL